MNFLIANTFTASLSKLNNQEQRAAMITAFKLQMNPANPGMSLHRIDRARDQRFWSARVNDDIRLILHKTDQNMVICYVGHHDKVYDWASRRKLETHPKTGAAQFVEIRETVLELFTKKYVEAPTPSSCKPRLFANVSEDYLLGCGVPPEWLGDVCNANNEDNLLDIAVHLPEEAADALLNLAGGKSPDIVTTAPDVDPFDHPHAQIRFRKTRDREDLKRTLTCPWGKNAAAKIAYVMSRYDYPIINEVLTKRFNQTEAFEYLAQQLNVKATTLRNYRDSFDPHVKQENSNRRGWWQVKLTDEFQAIKDEYDKKDREAIKHEIEAILSVQPSLETPVTPASPAPAVDPFDHPDAQIRFRKTHDSKDLERALTYPWGRNAVVKIAYAMSRFDYPLINEVLKKKFNQTEALEYLAQKLNVKATTLRNYRDSFDPYVKQENSKRRGWWQVKLTDAFQAIKDEYDKKDREAIKHEIEAILSTLT